MPFSARRLAIAPVVATALSVAALAPSAVADSPGPTAGAPAANVAATALIVGGTSYPTVSASQMAQLWPVWSTGLGLENTAFPALISVPYPAQLAPITGAGDSLGASVAAGVSSLLGALATTYQAGQRTVVWCSTRSKLLWPAILLPRQRTP